MTFLDEMYLVGTLTDDHDTVYDGGHYVTPSILRDDGKENGGEAECRRDAARRVPRREAAGDSRDSRAALPAP